MDLNFGNYHSIFQAGVSARPFPGELICIKSYALVFLILPIPDNQTDVLNDSDDAIMDYHLTWR